MQAKQNNEGKFYCELHSEFQLLSIYLGEKLTRKSRLLCEKCMIEIINNQEKIQNLVSLKDFKNNPGNSILGAAKITDSDKKIDENQALQEIENLITKLEKSIQNQFVIIRQNIQQMRQQVGSIITELSNNLKLNEIIKQFELVKNMDSYQGTQELAQLEEQLNQINVNLIKTYVSAKEKVKDNQQLIVNNYYNKQTNNILSFKIVSNEIDSTFKTTFELLNKIVSLEIPLSVFGDIYQFPQIHFQISEGKQIQYQLLYQGTRDGLQAQYYWSKCNGQSNLLTIMTSKNGNKFGGYSPCVINSGLEYVKDPTMKSFLFQYNKKEIYKLKENSYAVYCNAGYGPTYGGGHDIHIAADFIGGYSHGLGTSYDISGYNIVDKANHIFGDETPQLQEIKVFKVIFP